MKKVFLLLLTVAAVFGIVACTTTTEEATTTAAATTTAGDSTTAEATTAAPTTAAPTTTAEPVVTYDNEETTLLIQSSTMDGVFNPFFYSSAYDGDVLGLVNVSLLNLDESGAVVASDYYPTVAQSYSIFYTDNLTTYASKETYEEGDYVVYEMVIKNDAKFSDGTVIDADDVLFNLYTYIDPAYNGSSTLYTLPILGLQEYRTQVPDPAALIPVAEAIYADSNAGVSAGYVANEVYTEAQYNTYWESFAQAGEKFAGDIVSYVAGNYINAVNSNGELYVDAYSSLGSAGAGFTPAEIAASDTLKVAYGMDMWGYGAISTDGLTFTGASGTDYVVADLTAAVYWEEIVAANTDETGALVGFSTWQGLSDYETTGDSDFVALATEKFLQNAGNDGDVPTVAGFVKGQKSVDGVLHETVKIILTEQNPKAILSIGVTVTPQHYYTAGFAYSDGAVINYGVELNSPEFMAHLATFNGAPMGAGTYVFDHRDSGDGTVYFTRNTYFETLGGENVYNATINNVAFKIISSGAEYNALVAGDVHYATVSATADVMEDIVVDGLTGVLVDNLGYGYICVNPEVYPNLNFRIALTTVFDMTKVLDYYPNGLADLITRSQSQVSWAYPEGADYIYDFDETLVSTISYFEAAGYTYDTVTGEFTDVPDIDFTLPSETDAHPAGGVYLRAQELLATIGVTANIVVDTNLIANIKAAPVGVYALAWQSGADPDMYQVYHYMSQAESVQSNGIAWLYANGDNNALGTIDVVKLDGSTVTMNQAEAVQYLGDLIEEGVKYMMTEERAPIYAKALEVLAQLNIEIPTYQRKNLFVYNGSVIDQTTVSTTVTPYWGPLTEIWKVSFVNGD